MEIGNWKATEELNVVYRRARELGIETNLMELEAYGFTIIEPERFAPRAFTKRMLEAVLAAADREAPATVDMNAVPQKDRKSYGRNLFHMIEKDDIFVEALLNPVALTIGKYLMGASGRLYTNTAFVKREPVGCTHLHSDSSGMPPPLPFFGNVCNLSWILTDYTKERGTFYIVPGSHRLCRHPTLVDQPKFMGGPADDDLGIPIVAKAGSLFVFHGNTWHGTYPKTDPDIRVHVVFAICRNYINPAESFADLPDEMVARHGDEFARLVGRAAWQGYGREGPPLDRLGALARANQSSAA